MTESELKITRSKDPTEYNINPSVTVIVDHYCGLLLQTFICLSMLKLVCVHIMGVLGKCVESAAGRRNLSVSMIEW
jgi:hypothetical protein